MDLQEKFGVKETPENTVETTEKNIETTETVDKFPNNVVETKEDDDEPKALWEEQGFDSRDAFLSHYEELNKTVEQKEQERIALEEDYNKKIEDIKSKQVMYNDDEDLLRLSILKNKDEEKYKEAVDMLFGEKDPMKVLINSMKKKYSDLDEEDIKEIVKSKYNLDEEEPDEFADEAEIKRWKRNQKINQIEMREAADAIIAKQREEFNSIELPYARPKTKEQSVIEKVNAKKEWEQYYDKIPAEVGKLEYEFKVGDDKTISATLELTDEQKEKYGKMMADYIYDNAIKATEDNAKQIGAMLREVIERDQKQAMIEQMAEKMNEYYAEFYESKITNPSTSRNPMEAVGGNDSKKGLKSMFNYLKNK